MIVYFVSYTFAYFVCEVDELSVQRIDKHPHDNSRTVDDK